MAKNKKGKIIQMLSPENYIRKKARTLLIHECWINSDWEETQKANIIIARKHTNGNFTVGFFLVDLLCLGIKDTHFKFNIFESNYKEILELGKDDIDLEKTDYTLVHNIIFAGLEFADDYGFKPHKDYTSTMQYFLEDDTDDIELMEIECGHNNQTMYVQGPYEHEIEANRIMVQLEKTAGVGNYQFIRQKPDDLHFDDDFLEDDIVSEEMTLDENMELFMSQLSEIEKMTPEERTDFADLCEVIIDDSMDHEKADKFYDSFINNLEDIEIVEEIPDEMLDIDNKAEINAEEFKSQFLELYNLIDRGESRIGKKLKRLQKVVPDNPAVCFLELSLLFNKKSFRYKPQLKKYSELFPGYPLIKLLNQISNLDDDKYHGQDLPFENIIESFFPGRKELHSIEMFHLIMFLLFRANKSNNIEELYALDYLIEEIGLSESDIEMFARLITIGKMEFIMLLQHV